MNQKGIAPIAIILIIIGALAVGGGVWYVKEKKKTEEIEKQTEELAQNQSQQTINEETKDWKTYKDENGFEFKYPNYLEQNNGNYWPEDAFLVRRDIDKETTLEALKLITTIIDTKNQSFEELFQEFTRSQDENVVGPSGVKKIPNLNGLTYEIGSGDAAYFYAIILANNLKIEIEYVCGGGPSFINCRNRRDQIISTFKFIN